MRKVFTQVEDIRGNLNDVGQTSVKRMFLIPKLSDVPPVIRISIPVQNVASVARYKHVSPTSSGVPCRPNN
jgi:hypothetical protein